MGLCIQTISNTFHFFPSRWFITDFLPQPHRCPFPLYLHSVSLNKLFDFEIKKQIFSIWTQNPLPFFFFLEFFPQRAALFNANNLVLQIVFTTFGKLWHNIQLCHSFHSSFFSFPMCVWRHLTALLFSSWHSEQRGMSYDGMQAAVCTSPLQPSLSVFAKIQIYI